MTTVTVEIRCPHCRRAHQVTLELERLQRVRPRAHCARCGQSFDVAASLRDRDRSVERPTEDAEPVAAAAPATEQDGRPTMEPPEPFDVEELSLDDDEAPAPRTPPLPPPTPGRITRPTPAPPGRLTPLPSAAAPPTPPPPPRKEPPRPPSWLEMADPGLSGLDSSPAASAVALVSLLTEGTRRGA